MSQRSLIIKKEEGKFFSVYHRYDGYPSYTGKLLKENYLDEVKLDQLMQKGYIVSLKPTIEETRFFTDTGDKLVIDYYKSKSELKKDVRKYGCWLDYVYLWDQGKWYFSTTSLVFKELTDEKIIRDSKNYDGLLEYEMVIQMAGIMKRSGMEVVARI